MRKERAPSPHSAIANPNCLTIETIPVISIPRLLIPCFRMRIIGWDRHQPSFFEHRKIKVAQTTWIGDYFSPCDFPIEERAAKHTKYMSARRPDQSHLSVNQHGLYSTRKLSRECDRSLRPIPCATNLPRRSRTGSGFIDSDHNIGIKHRDQTFKITAAQSVEERVNDPSLLHEASLGNRWRTLNATSCPTRQLSGRFHRAPKNGSDFVKRNGKHVVQNERQSLGRIEPVKHDQQCRAD